MRRYLLAALVVPLLAASSAQAALPTDRQQTTTRATESLRIARAFWGVDLPARVYAATPAQLATATSTSAVVGAATAGELGIWIKDTQLANTYVWRISNCTTIVHEYGHLLGVEHSTDSRSVMSEDRGDSAVVYACYKRFLPKGKGREFRRYEGQPLWLTR